MSTNPASSRRGSKLEVLPTISLDLGRHRKREPHLSSATEALLSTQTFLMTDGMAVHPRGIGTWALTLRLFPVELLRWHANLELMIRQDLQGAVQFRPTTPHSEWGTSMRLRPGQRAQVRKSVS